MIDHSFRGLGPRFSGAALAFALAGTASCAIVDGGDKGDRGDDLVSNRPQTDKYFSAIVKLGTAPLLETASRGSDGVMVIDKTAAATIAAEQASFVQNLQGRSSEVRVLYNYRLVMNGVAILAPVAMRDAIKSLSGVSSIDETTRIAPPRDVPEPALARAARSFTENSVKWIGGAKARAELGLTGRGVRVGVIDTGIDYTHKMFDGPGTPDAYTNNQPGVIEPNTFPTRRVVAGVDLVGQDYDSASPIETNRVPVPDADPLDAYGHGTHVAGTIGGIGDDENTYDGVAPEVDLYAVKVFAKGSTDEAPIIAALEYAADPNADGDLSDRLDVVNLSLGSDWGTRLGLYSEVVTTLGKGGTFFVASAGNSGGERYIVGSPSTADEALSVAASTDNATSTVPADLLVGFSSWGPRSLDAILKPEIAAPGSRIISAKMGGGTLGRAMSGTSMSSPHVTGVAALLRQAHPTATVADLKSLLMNSAAPMKDRTGAEYSVSKVGGGRVQAYEAAVSPLVFSPSSFSLGILPANTVNQGTRTVKVTNITSGAVHAQVSWQTSAGMTLSGASTLDVPAGGSADLDVSYLVDVTQAKVVETQVEGLAVLVLDADPARSVPALTLRVPTLAVATRGSEVTLAAAPLTQGPASVALTNHGPIAGDVLAFNLLGRDEIAGKARAGACDLSAAGYRIVHAEANGTSPAKDLLQFGVNLASAQSTWNFCELSVQVDTDGDGIAEQEIAGTFDENLRPTTFQGDPFASFLIDAPAMRAIQTKIEQGTAKPSDFPASVLDTQEFVRYPLSTVAYISADLAKVKRTAAGKLRVKIGVLPSSEGAVIDDFLGAGDGTWFEIDPDGLPYTAMTEKVSAPANSSATLAFTSGAAGAAQGAGDHALLVYLPQNSQAAGRAVVVSANGQTLAIP